MLPKMVTDAMGGLPAEWQEPLRRLAPDYKGMDTTIMDVVAARVAEWEMPDGLLTATDKNNKWRIVSCMQKAIRHGDVDMAMNAAHAGVSIDPSYTFRRLGICSIEDVGVGNLLPVLGIMATLGNAARRHQIGDAKLAVWLAAQMAEGVKCRLGCELLVWVECDTSLASAKEAWATRSDDDLVQLLENAELPFQQRILASWLLAGTKRFWGRTVPKTNDRPRDRLMNLFLEQGMPVALYYLAEMVARRLLEGMFVSLMWIHRMLEATEECTVREMLIPNRCKRLGKLSSAGYDMHTREGRIAINKFFRECEEVGQYLRYAKDGMEDRLKNCGVFVAEGGVIHRRLVYQGSEVVYNQAHRHEILETGVPPGKVDAFIKAIEDNIEKLHDCRRRVVWASQNRK